MNVEELFRLDELELALLILRSPDISPKLFPAARKATRRLERGRSDGVFYYLKPAEYYSVRRSVIKSFQLTSFKSASFDLHHVICNMVRYCKYREMPIAEMVRVIAEAIENSGLLPGEMALVLTVLLFKIRSFDLFCACNTV